MKFNGCVTYLQWFQSWSTHTQLSLNKTALEAPCPYSELIFGIPISLVCVIAPDLKLRLGFRSLVPLCGVSVTAKLLIKILRTKILWVKIPKTLHWEISRCTNKAHPLHLRSSLTQTPMFLDLRLRFGRMLASVCFANSLDIQPEYSDQSSMVCVTYAIHTHQVMCAHVLARSIHKLRILKLRISESELLRNYHET